MKVQEAGSVMEKKYNTKSPAVKRLMREAAEMASTTADYHATPLEDNLFEWHFTVRGPEGTDFQGGVYHGRIIVPPDYPMKPPDIIVLTPNGRFTVGKKICLSISGYHPETWQPSWSIRTALLAIIGFMPTPGHGTIGSLDYTPQERRQLAQKSVSFCCDVCGLTSRLLASPTPACSSSQESTVAATTTSSQDQEELRHILQSMALKGEEEILEEKKVQQPEETGPQPAPLQQTAATGDPVAAVAAVCHSAAAGGDDVPPPAAAASSRTNTSTGTDQLAATNSPAYRIEDDGGNSRAVQVYDVLIMIVVALIGVLIFRRVAITDLEDMETSEGHLHNEGI